MLVIDSRTARADKHGERNLFGTKYWYTGHTNLQCPPKITALYAKRLPPAGGDTCFANAYRMFAGLSAERQAELLPLRTVNSADRHYVYAGSRSERIFNASQPAIHPLVRRHPQTGQLALYVHPLKATRIEGWEELQSLKLIEQVLEEALTPELSYRHRWRLGDLVLIDNRACLHRAMRD